jgi:hypothetical protein
MLRSGLWAGKGGSYAWLATLTADSVEQKLDRRVFVNVHKVHIRKLSEGAFKAYWLYADRYQ